MGILDVVEDDVVLELVDVENQLVLRFQLTGICAPVSPLDFHWLQKNKLKELCIIIIIKKKSYLK